MVKRCIVAVLTAISYSALPSILTLTVTKRMKSISKIFAIMTALSQLCLVVGAKTIVECQAPVDEDGNALPEISSGIALKFTCNWPKEKKIYGEAIRVRMLNTQTKISSAMSGTKVSNAVTGNAPGSYVLDNVFETTLNLDAIPVDLRQVKFCVYDSRDTIKSHKGCTPPVLVKTNANPIADSAEREQLDTLAVTSDNVFQQIPKFIKDGANYGPMNVAFANLDPIAIEIILQPLTRLASPIPVAAQQIRGGGTAVQVSFTAPAVNAKGQSIKICLRYKANRKIITCSPPVQNGEFLVPKRRLFGRPAIAAAPINLRKARNGRNADNDAPNSEVEPGSTVEEQYDEATAAALAINSRELPGLLQKAIIELPAEFEPFSEFSHDSKLLTGKLLAGLVDKRDPIPAEEVKYAATLLEFSPGQLKTVLQMIDDKAANEEIPVDEPINFINNRGGVRWFKQSSARSGGGASVAPVLFSEDEESSRSSSIESDAEEPETIAGDSSLPPGSQHKSAVPSKDIYQNCAKVIGLAHLLEDSELQDHLTAALTALESSPAIPENFDSFPEDRKTEAEKLLEDLELDTVAVSKYAATLFAFTPAQLKTVMQMIDEKASTLQSGASLQNLRQDSSLRGTKFAASQVDSDLTIGSRDYDSDEDGSNAPSHDGNLPPFLQPLEFSSDSDDEKRTEPASEPEPVAAENSGAGITEAAIVAPAEPSVDQYDPIQSKIRELLTASPSANAKKRIAREVKYIETSAEIPVPFSHFTSEKKKVFAQIMKILNENPGEMTKIRAKAIFIKSKDFSHAELKSIFAVINGSKIQE